MEQQKEKLPKINKTVGLIGHPFRLVSEKGFETLKTSYEYFKKYNKQMLFKETNDGFFRYDKESKQWVVDSKNNYWYTDEKTGKNRSFIDVSTNYMIEFKEPTNIECWEGSLITKKVNKCTVGFSGNQNFGQVKCLFDKLTEYENMGKTRTGIYIEMYKDGIRYNFKYHSDYVKPTPEVNVDVSPSTFKPAQVNLSLTPQSKDEMTQDLKNSIEALKMDEYLLYTKPQIKKVFTSPENGLSISNEFADKLIQQHFNDRAD